MYNFPFMKVTVLCSTFHRAFNFSRCFAAGILATAKDVFVAGSFTQLTCDVLPCCMYFCEGRLP